MPLVLTRLLRDGSWSGSAELAVLATVKILSRRASFNFQTGSSPLSLGRAGFQPGCQFQGTQVEWLITLAAGNIGDSDLTSERGDFPRRLRHVARVGGGEVRVSNLYHQFIRPGRNIRQAKGSILITKSAEASLGSLRRAKFVHGLDILIRGQEIVANGA